MDYFSSETIFFCGIIVGIAFGYLLFLGVDYIKRWQAVRQRRRDIKIRHARRVMR